MMIRVTSPVKKKFFWIKRVLNKKKFRDLYFKNHCQNQHAFTPLMRICHIKFLKLAKFWGWRKIDIYGMDL